MPADPRKVASMYREEQAAKACHDIWSHWMKYQLTAGTPQEDGSYLLSAEDVARWTRQMHTAYEDLSEKEKESDREVARLFLLE